MKKHYYALDYGMGVKLFLLTEAKEKKYRKLFNNITDENQNEANLFIEKNGKFLGNITHQAFL